MLSTEATLTSCFILILRITTHNRTGTSSLARSAYSWNKKELVKPGNSRGRYAKFTSLCFALLLTELQSSPLSDTIYPRPLKSIPTLFYIWSINWLQRSNCKTFIFKGKLPSSRLKLGLSSLFHYL